MRIRPCTIKKARVYRDAYPLLAEHLCISLASNDLPEGDRQQYNLSHCDIISESGDAACDAAKLISDALRSKGVFRS